jgi:hypothetical protein
MPENPVVGGRWTRLRRHMKAAILAAVQGAARRNSAAWVVGRCFGESGVDAVVFDIADRDAEGGFGIAADFTKVGDAPTLRLVM